MEVCLGRLPLQRRCNGKGGSVRHGLFGQTVQIVMYKLSICNYSKSRRTLEA